MWSGALDSSKPQNLVITGFMGTGKTTVGQLVAQWLDLPFIDSDAELVERTGASISELFARHGEEGFRTIESVLCRWLASRAGIVVATGGGMLVNVHNLAAMTASGLVVCLTASTEALEGRLKMSDERPLAWNWQQLLEQRRSAYAAIPHQVDTTGKAPQQVAEEVIALWRASQ